MRTICTAQANRHAGPIGLERTLARTQMRRAARQDA